MMTLPIPIRSTPPGQVGRPYVLSHLEGDTLYFPGQNSVIRMLATGKETSGEFALVGGSGIGGLLLPFLALFL